MRNTNTLRVLVFASVILFVSSYLHLYGNENKRVSDQYGITLGTGKVNEAVSAGVSRDEFEWSDNSLGSLIGEEVPIVFETLGEPVRKEPSAYGYTWYIFNRDVDYYVQVGVLAEKVVTIYALGKENNVAPFKIGDSLESAVSIDRITPEVHFKLREATYHVKLSEEDQSVRPLIKMGQTFVQVYMDELNNTLSSIRFLDGETLIKHKSYEMFFQGQRMEVGKPTEKEWGKIKDGLERQIFDLTNVMRGRHGLSELEWDEKTANAAFAHSKDMRDSRYFSHVSKKKGSLEDRLKTAAIFYQLAGENIAAHYVDGPDVVEAWMNSKGHRKAILNGDFSHIGIGVHRQYYTQNFVRIEEE